jgi:hypothetical protein
MAAGELADCAAKGPERPNHKFLGKTTRPWIWSAPLAAIATEEKTDEHS